MDYTWHYDSSLGGITLASDGEALIGLWFDGQRYFADTLDKEHKVKRLPVFDDTCRWLDTYFSGKAPDFTPKLNMRTSAFRKKVWEIMLAIPFGQTMTYGGMIFAAMETDYFPAAFERRVGKDKGLKRMSAQAVGSAVGHNSISLIIPCHRVVGTNGSLTGYAGGIDKKVRLLQMEKALSDRLFVSKKGTAL